MTILIIAAVVALCLLLAWWDYRCAQRDELVFGHRLQDDPEIDLDD